MSDRRRPSSPFAARRTFGLEITRDRKVQAEKLEALNEDLERMRTENKQLKSRVTMLTTELKQARGESTGPTSRPASPSKLQRRTASPSPRMWSASPTVEPKLPVCYLYYRLLIIMLQVTQEMPRMEYPAKLIAHLEQSLTSARRDIDRYRLELAAYHASM